MGTIAKSGSREYVAQLKEAKDATTGDSANIIGQFGVGFYAAFMVANNVGFFLTTPLRNPLLIELSYFAFSSLNRLRYSHSAKLTRHRWATNGPQMEPKELTPLRRRRMQPRVQRLSSTSRTIQQNFQRSPWLSRSFGSTATLSDSPCSLMASS